jgi:hypothetical protein
MERSEATPEVPVSWVESDGWIFEAVPGTPYIIGTPDPERGVWVMGTDPDECRREWERLSPTWWGYRPSAGPERGE